MKLSTRSKEYLIPEYSLTGDLLSFLTCNLQYRYQNKGDLPPSMPIQLWFGEFIHGIMEEAFLHWENMGQKERLDFPWNWETQIKPIEELIIERLKVNGLNPPMDYLMNYGPENNIYSARVERSINVWGPHLFPLIEDAEVLIKGIRKMPKLDDGTIRSEFYSINGVIDVLSSFKLDQISNLISSNSEKSIEDYNSQSSKKSFQDTLDSFFVVSTDEIKNYHNDELENSNEKDILRNKILEYLASNDEFKALLKNYDGDEDYEVIIDYKGMRRPSAPLNIDLKNRDLNQYFFKEDTADNLSKKETEFRNWIQHEWQILTYAWLRNNQENQNKVLCGIIFYLNELVPSTDDLLSIKEDLINDNTDISKDFVSKEDWDILINWNPETDNPIHRDLSDEFKMNRSIRVIPIKEDLIEGSLSEFDNVVKEIEGSMINELNGYKIKEAWKADAEERTCSACDFRSFCNKKHSEEKNNIPKFTIP